MSCIIDMCKFCSSGLHFKSNLTDLEVERIKSRKMATWIFTNAIIKPILKGRLRKSFAKLVFPKSKGRTGQELLERHRFNFRC